MAQSLRADHADGEGVLFDLRSIGPLCYSLQARIDRDNGLDTVMKAMPLITNTMTLESDEVVPWWKNPAIHFYIIEGQQTYTACVELSKDSTLSVESRRELLNFYVVPIFSRDKLTFIRVSNALNLNLAEKIAKENFRSCCEQERAAWKVARYPEPHRGGGKPSSAF